MSDQTDIFGAPVPDAENARESFLAGGIGANQISDLGGAGLRELLPRIADMIRDLRRECSFHHNGCELGRGHPGPHLIPMEPDPRAGWAVVDDDGKLLREI